MPAITIIVTSPTSRRHRQAWTRSATSISSTSLTPWSTPAPSPSRGLPLCSSPCRTRRSSSSTRPTSSRSSPSASSKRSKHAPWMSAPAPLKPTGSRARVDLARYDEEMSSYDRQAEVVRRKQVELDMRQGWVLTDYFLRSDSPSSSTTPRRLSESMGQMVYGMDVRPGPPPGRADPVPAAGLRRVRPPCPSRADRAHARGEEACSKATSTAPNRSPISSLADPHQDHADAMFVKARVRLLQRRSRKLLDQFDEVVHTAQQSAHPRLGPHLPGPALRHQGSHRATARPLRVPCRAFCSRSHAGRQSGRRNRPQNSLRRAENSPRARGRRAARPNREKREGKLQTRSSPSLA